MTLSAIAVPSVVMRVASHAGTRPPCSGRSAVPERFTRSIVAYAGSGWAGRAGRAGWAGWAGWESTAYVGEPEVKEAERSRAGLCADCLHARRIESSRGSIFYLCLRAEHDPAYKKYPPLPVRS